MKNTKGFTLIELLGVIVIIIVILAIITINLLKISDNTKSRSKKEEIKEIENAAEDYFITNENYLTDLNDNESIYVSIGTLVDENYLNSITDVYSNKKFDKCDIVVVSKINGKIAYQYMDNKTAVNNRIISADSCSMTPVVISIITTTKTKTTTDEVLPEKTTSSSSSTTKKPTTTKKNTTSKKATTTKKVVTTSVCSKFKDANIKNISKYITVSVSGNKLLNYSIANVNPNHKEYNRVKFKFNGLNDGNKIKFNSDVSAEWSSKKIITKTSWHSGWNSNLASNGDVTKNTWCITNENCYTGSHKTFYVTACAYAKCDNTAKKVCYAAVAYRDKKVVKKGFTYVGN